MFDYKRLEAVSVAGEGAANGRTGKAILFYEKM